MQSDHKGVVETNYGLTASSSFVCTIQEEEIEKDGEGKVFSLCFSFSQL